jgi:NADH-quinone oxidoreductase subunit C
MDATAIVDVLKAALPAASIEAADSLDLHATVHTSPADLLAVLKELRDNSALKFVFLSALIATDDAPREPRYALSYLLVSFERGARVRLKVRLEEANAKVGTASGLWKAANWLEREVWDMFGIEFDNHPDPRRLLMPDDWEGYPLRKDYPLQIQKTPTTTEPMQVTEEEFRRNLEQDRLVRR